MDEQYLNKKLAEWAGWKDITDSPFGMIAFDPLEKQGAVLYKRNVPDFTQSLDACFKWLVPKMLESLRPVSILAYPVSGKYPNIGFHCELNGSAKDHYAEAGTPALALCLAIEKLIDAEQSS